jgi:hypothetical protein
MDWNSNHKPQQQNLAQRKLSVAASNYSEEHC